MQKGKKVVSGGLQIAEKGREAKGKGKQGRYFHLSAEFQRKARRGKKGSSVINAKKWGGGGGGGERKTSDGKD